MAEFVDRRLERGLGELEQMVHAGLFTSDELKSIVAKRQKLEYNVQRYEKSVEDHLKYVKYEMSLLELTKLRRKRLGYDYKFNEIEGSIGKRCQLRLMRAETKYPNDMEVWRTHIQLCKLLRWNPAASQVYTRMLQLHSDKPEIWIEASDFELSENGSPDSARDLCLKALRWHPKNHELWLHHLSVELSIATKVFQRGDILGIDASHLVKDDDPITGGKVCMAVAENAIKNIDSVDFAGSLYECVLRARKQDKLPEGFWKPLANFILSKMEEKYGDTPEYWKRRAALVLVGLDEPTEYEMIKAEEEAFQIMNSAVERLPSESMWHAYMDFLSELFGRQQFTLHPEWLELSRKRSIKAFEVFEQAETKGFVQFRHYISWASLLNDRRRTKEAEAVLKKAASVCPDELEAYMKLIVAFSSLAGDQSGTITELINAARKKLPRNDPGVWKQLLDWTIHFQPSKVEEVFREAMQQSMAIRSQVALQYVTWAYSTDLSSGRKIYKTVRDIPGAFSESLVKFAIAQEKKNSAPIASLRKMFDDALSFVGKDSVDLWIEYIRTELTYEGGDPLASGKLVSKAQKTLRPEFLTLFTTMNNLLMANLTK
ncbi:hypothetical protein RvY_02771 [Ramazzottius varieornatus]|uniref:U3 small nucleolar RNA-associated protein 6 homolog n=1 Tax=Ramazzottius varieornatus TaxID=947166 RepID=A0A1D1UVE9_RAMVA|nr:hypothetical protein RvY_02771 [Ramazzottius varieornatus]